MYTNAQEYEETEIAKLANEISTKTLSSTTRESSDANPVGTIVVLMH